MAYHYNIVNFCQQLITENFSFKYRYVLGYYKLTFAVDVSNETCSVADPDPESGSADGNMKDMTAKKTNE
jgi:hypothetical protein